MISHLRRHLDIKEAYLAMYGFLQGLHQATKSDYLGGLLGGMSLLEDGTTADPAVWSDWLAAIERVRRGDMDAGVDLKS